MFPLEVYELIIVIDAILFLYAFIDINHKFYGNIIALGVATLFSFFLALVSVSGSIIINYASSTTTGGVDYLNDSSLMWIFILLGIIEAAFTLYLAYDAYTEYLNERKLRGDWVDEE
jgi:hypothetical protein